MKRGRAPRDPKEATDLPSRLATCCPLRALVFARRQTHAVNDPVSGQFPSNEHVKAGRDVREIVFIAFRGTDECSIALISGKGHRWKIASEIYDRDRQTTADAELRRFVKALLLSFRWLNTQCRAPSASRSSVSSHWPKRCGIRPHRPVPKAVPKIFRRQIACLPL